MNQASSLETIHVGRIPKGWTGLQRSGRLALLLALALALSLAPIDVRTAKALPAFGRTVGLTVASAGWSNGVDPLNPPMIVYKGTTVTMFLRSTDNVAHQLVINTVPAIKSPPIPNTSTGVMFTFTVGSSGIFTYCDVFNPVSCGIFQIKIRGDVNGDNIVDLTDIILVSSKFLSSLGVPAAADRPYPDGRVDYTDLNIVGFYFGQLCPCAVGTPYTPDLNGDGIVDISDLSLVGGAIGTTAPYPFNNPNQGPDLNYDNVIDLSDLILVSNCIGAPLYCL